MKYGKRNPWPSIAAGVLFALAVHTLILIWFGGGRPTISPLLFFMMGATHAGWLMHVAIDWPDRPNSIGNLIVNSVYWPLIFSLVSIARHKWRMRNATDDPLCGACGYNLHGNTSGVCPECGVMITVGMPQLSEVDRGHDHDETSTAHH